jgi:hypothetical protein
MGVVVVVMVMVMGAVVVVVVVVVGVNKGRGSMGMGLQAGMGAKEERGFPGCTSTARSSRFISWVLPGRRRMGGLGLWLG